MIKIITWFNDPHDCDLTDILDLCKKAAKPGNKIVMVETDRTDYGVAIVLYKGEGTKTEVRKAFEKAWDDLVRGEG